MDDTDRRAGVGHRTGLVEPWFSGVNIAAISRNGLKGLQEGPSQHQPDIRMQGAILPRGQHLVIFAVVQ